MEIVCGQCQSRFKVPEDKIPADKAVSIPCPKCKNKITVQKPDDSISAGRSDASPPDDFLAETYDAAEKPFDFVEEEGKTALVCEPDAAVKKTVIAALEQMEYHITDAKDAAEALSNMRYHVYDLVLVNEAFDTSDPDRNRVLNYLERLPMAIRRNIFVVLLSGRYRTQDNMMAFNKSVNMILNAKNIRGIGKILGRSITENDLFYRVYKDTLKNLGKV